MGGLDLSEILTPTSPVPTPWAMILEKKTMIERVGRYGSPSVTLTVLFFSPEDGIIREDELADFYTKFVKLESQEAKVVAKTAHDTMTDVRITI